MNWTLTLIQAAGDAAQNANDSSSSGGGNPLANYLLLAGVALLIFVLWFNVRKRVAGHQNLDPREKIERDKQVTGMKNDLRTMMVELDELTRRFSSQLDAKAVKLERLIEQADQRIARLQGQRGVIETPDTPEEEQVSDREAASDEDTEQDEADPLAENVYKLADEGHDPGEIARRLDEHIGKVELILALRQQA